jgi:hypothetical protein
MTRQSLYLIYEDGEAEPAGTAQGSEPGEALIRFALDALGRDDYNLSLDGVLTLPDGRCFTARPRGDLHDRLTWKPGDVQVEHRGCTCMAVDDFKSGVGFMDRRGCPVHDPDGTWKPEPLQQ